MVTRFHTGERLKVEGTCQGEEKGVDDERERGKQQSIRSEEEERETG